MPIRAIIRFAEKPERTPIFIYEESDDFDGPNDVIMEDADDDIDVMEVEEASIPDKFKCCITLQLMNDPWIDTNDGCSYEREAIFQWLKKDKTSPLTREPLTKSQLAPNFALRKAIRKFREEHPGIDFDLH